MFKRFSYIALVFIYLFAADAAAQTTAFNYQGKLTDTGAPQTTYQMQFRLFDSATGGSQIGATVENPSVAVEQGVFSVTLDFGASAFTGADRFLEIGVRRNANESYTILNPRQQIASSPYSIRTLSAAQADISLDSEKLGGIAASEYVTNANVGGSFIRNGTTPQTANFNISGDGALSRLAVGLNTPRAGYLLDINGNAQITPGGGSGAILFGTPNAETGLSFLNTNRADVRFDGSTLKLLAGAGTGTPSSLSGLTINTAGNAGLGIAPNPNFRLDSFGSIRALSNTSAHFVAETNGGTNTWARTYWRSPSRSWFMGTSQNFNGNQLYIADETAGQTRMVITTNGFVGIGTTNPGAGLEVSGTGFNAGQRLTDNTSGNSLVLQSGAGNNMKITGYNYGTSTAVPLYLSVDGANTILNSGGGNVGIGTTTPNARLTVNGNATQNLGSFGLPKAMAYVNGDGTILRCFNGVTGASTGNCGFSVSKPAAGWFGINFGFNVSDRIKLLTAENFPTVSVRPVTMSYDFSNSLPNSLTVYIVESHSIGTSGGPFHTDRPFHIVIF